MDRKRVTPSSFIAGKRKSAKTATSTSASTNSRQKGSNPTGTSTSNSSTGVVGGSVVRRRAVALLESTLQLSGGGGGDDHIAADIEAEIYQQCSDESEYQRKFKTIQFNLKQNGKLRDSVCKGEVEVSTLCAMSSEELASDEIKEAREAARSKLMNKTMIPQLGTVSTLYTCRKCKSKKCNVTQAQTRSADEPMTTFVSCMECGHVVKF